MLREACLIIGQIPLELPSAIWEYFRQSLRVRPFEDLEAIVRWKRYQGQSGTVKRLSSDL